MSIPRDTQIGRENLKKFHYADHTERGLDLVIKSCSQVITPPDQ